MSIDQHKLAKDFGLHLEHLGFDEFESMIFPDVSLTYIGQIDPDIFSTSGTVVQDGERYVVTFDFDSLVFQLLKGKIPDIVHNELNKRGKSGSRKNLAFLNNAFVVTIDCKIGNKFEENKDEIFQLLIVNRFL